MYASTLKSHLEDFDTDLSGYADDHGCYKFFDPLLQGSESDTILKLEECLVEVQNWMSLNRLKMNTT